MVAMVLVMVIPASAALTHYFFIPEQEVGGASIPAQTLTCEDTNDPINIETCRNIGLGNQVPADLICDVPVTLEFRGEPLIPGLTVYQCRTVEEAEPLPPAPITQEGEQDGESGEIDQSYDVS
jgi:hypothetical protein